MKSCNQRGRVSGIVVFKKWGRRNYSLFSTLKRVVHISVLSVTYFIAVPKAAVTMPRDTSDVKMQYDLDEVEVTASRVPVVYSQVARVLTVIDAQEIERMPAESVQDLLEYVAGVDIRQRGAEGVQADISIRGGTFDQILILLNGINITDPQTGHHNLNLPVSLAQIERIEILKGPAARVYGPNSFSGAINIITRKPQAESVFAQISTGSFGYFNGDLSGSFLTGKLKHFLAVNRKNSDGYIENTDFSSINGFYFGEWVTGAGNFTFQGGISGKGFGANSFYTPVYPNQFEEIQTAMGSVRFESNTKLKLVPSVYWRRHSDKFMLFRNEAPGWYTNHNYHQTDVWGADINSWLLWGAGKTSFGAGIRSESILSNVLGEPMESRMEFQGEDRFYTHSKERAIGSLYFEHALFVNRWIFNAGMMVNYISDNHEGMNFFPGFDVSYQATEPLKIIASWNTSLRMPTFTDLYYSGPTNIGNPELKPERSSAMEFGLKYNKQNVKGHLVYYHRKGFNLIDWVKTIDDEVWKSMNHTEITSQGIDFHVFYFPLKHLSPFIPQKIEAGYLYNRQKKDETSIISYYVLDNLKHKFVASVTHQVSNRMIFDVRASYQDREGTFNYYDGIVYTGEREYRPFWTFDVKASYKVSGMNFFVTANNLFDRQFYDIGNVIQPGRWIKAGVSFGLSKAE